MTLVLPSQRPELRQNIHTTENQGQKGFPVRQS